MFIVKQRNPDKAWYKNLYRSLVRTTSPPPSWLSVQEYQLLIFSDPVDRSGLLEPIIHAAGREGIQSLSSNIALFVSYSLQPVDK